MIVSEGKALDFLATFVVSVIMREGRTPAFLATRVVLMLVRRGRTPQHGNASHCNVASSVLFPGEPEVMQAHLIYR